MHFTGDVITWSASDRTVDIGPGMVHSAQPGALLGREGNGLAGARGILEAKATTGLMRSDAARLSSCRSPTCRRRSVDPRASAATTASARAGTQHPIAAHALWHSLGPCFGHG